MKFPLTLKYRAKAFENADAYLLPSSSVEALFIELEALAITFATAKIYAIDAKAFLIIASAEGKVLQSEACCHAGGGLYVPADAELFPACRADEVAALTGQNVSLLHPFYGFSSWAAGDALSGDALLEMPFCCRGKWQTPYSPGKSVVELSGIFPIEVLSPDEMIENMQENIAQKDPEELTEEDHNLLDGLLGKAGMPPITKGAAAAGGMALKGLLGLSRMIPSSGRTAADGPGLLDKFEDWASDKVNDLMNSRQKSLDKLLEMLKDDPEQGLQYAIPLNSEDMARGLGRSGGDLMRNDDYSLNGGSSTGVDYWDMDDGTSYRLRQQYERLAVKEQQKGDFMRAAYIYIRLLSDYSAAAKVLEKGGFYTEAASIYID
jgi:hypothetical protein